MFLPLTHLQQYNVVYLASPYTKYQKGPARAVQEVAVAAARLLRLGVRLFCPITHSGPITQADLLTDTHETWMGIDEVLAGPCGALVICDMVGWHGSVGVLKEVGIFQSQRKPIYLGVGLHFEHLELEPYIVRLSDAVRVDAGNLAAGKLRGKLEAA